MRYLNAVQNIQLHLVVLLLYVTLELPPNVSTLLSNNYKAPPCCIAVLLVKIAQQVSLNVTLVLLTECIAPPCCLAILLLKCVVDTPVNQI